MDIYYATFIDPSIKRRGVSFLLKGLSFDSCYLEKCILVPYKYDSKELQEAFIEVFKEVLNFIENELIKNKGYTIRYLNFIGSNCEVDFLQYKWKREGGCFHTFEGYLKDQDFREICKNLFDEMKRIEKKYKVKFDFKDFRHSNGKMWSHDKIAKQKLSNIFDKGNEAESKLYLEKIQKKREEELLKGYSNREYFNIDEIEVLWSIHPELVFESRNFTLALIDGKVIDLRSEKVIEIPTLNRNRKWRLQKKFIPEINPQISLKVKCISNNHSNLIENKEYIFVSSYEGDMGEVYDIETKKTIGVFSIKHFDISLFGYNWCKL
ncbi:hypothetical protein [Alkaliphilus sp. B6464]|uniref:hypothetical protein n=1 Tax=Alkaliphilus sp. B6464 TaxID=2731219 RepID=UPI001BA66CB2|nr:hypothetical protein [Alkaliphilus sp. B6464]QUH22055.1 hypothetical protein HYG84_19305 [Alkaliphilus sp. B6464]